MNNQKIRNIPSMSSLLKISIGLIILTIITSAFVYAETISVTIDGTSYDIDYTSNGVLVSGAEADLDFMSLILLVDVPDSSGTLDITLDRNFFDSTYQGADDSFIVLADGDEPTFTETETTQSRTLSIELPAGTEEVEIIGSEFGTPKTPVEEPTVEVPPVEEPTVEVPPVEEPTVEVPPVEKPKTECGPGTILKDGVCVLDQRCGPGTILKDDECVLAPQSSSPSSVKEMGTELVIALIAGFIIAGTVGVILALISKASKSKNN